MELMLEVISRHKFSGDLKPSYIFGEVGGYIGRGKESDWVLPDRTKKVSRKHVLISCDGHDFFLEDKSSNGIRSNLSHELLLPDIPHKVSHGDSFEIGDYVIQARLLQNPATYTSTPESVSDNIIPDDAFLDLDPLVALEQEEHYQAKKRLGLYDDLLGASPAALPEDSISDHNEARLDAMLSVTAIPEAWEDESTSALPQEPFMEISKLGASSTTQAEIKCQAEKSSEFDIFFEALGFENVPEDQNERQRMILLAADLLRASIEGLIRSLQHRADSKNEFRLPITTVQITGNNPLKFSPSSAMALNHLLAKKQDGLLDAVDAVNSSFDDLHSHHLGLLAGARAAMSAALTRLSPDKIVERLDSGGQVKFRREVRLWNNFLKLHNELMAQEGLEDFFLHDFARAYEMQVRTLDPTKKRS